MQDDQITVTLPLHTAISEVMDAWIAEAVKKAGTQLKAAYHLEMTPETISRRLNRRRRKQAQMEKV